MIKDLPLLPAGMSADQTRKSLVILSSNMNPNPSEK